MQPNQEITPNPVNPPPAPAPTQKIGSMGKVKDEAKLIVEKISEFMKSLDPKQKRMFAILEVVIIILVVLLVLSAFVSVVRPRKNNEPQATLPPSVIPTPIPDNLPPSKYATDSAVLEIEDSVKNLDRDLDNFQFKDPDLKLPEIFFDGLTK